MNTFKCKSCNGAELAYEDYVLRRKDVLINPDDHIEYGNSVIDESKDLGAGFGYACKKCGHPLFYLANRIETEQELKTYLSMDPGEIEKNEEQYFAAMKEEEEEREREEEAITEAMNADLEAAEAVASSK